MKVELDLSSYATKEDLKNAKGVNASDFATKTYSANLKLDVDKLDLGKLETAPVDLSKLSKVVKNDVID